MGNVDDPRVHRVLESLRAAGTEANRAAAGVLRIWGPDLPPDAAEAREEAIRSASAAMDSANATYRQYLLDEQEPVDPPVDPPGGGEPPPDPPPPPPPPTDIVEPTPPPLHVYPRDFTHEIDGQGRWRRVNGEWTTDASAYPITACYDDHMAGPNRGARCVISTVRGQDGIGFGQWYNVAAQQLLGRTGAPLDIDIVGPENSADLWSLVNLRNIQLGNTFAPVKHVGLYSCSLEGGSNSHIVSQGGPIGELVFVNGTLETSRDFTSSQSHSSGLHLKYWDRLFVYGLRRHPNTKLKEHPLYIKGNNDPATGETWILESDLTGGNRTGVQYRPHQAYSHQGKYYGAAGKPGPVYIAGCAMTGAGWEYVNAGGGYALTLWHTSGDVWIKDNRVVDSRYGCLLLGYQGPPRDWPNITPGGYSHDRVFVVGNVFDNDGSPGGGYQGGDRDAVNASAVRQLYWINNTVADSRGKNYPVIDPQSGLDRGAPKCGEVFYDWPDA